MEVAAVQEAWTWVVEGRTLQDPLRVLVGGVLAWGDGGALHPLVGHLGLPCGNLGPGQQAGWTVGRASCGGEMESKVSMAWHELHHSHTAPLNSQSIIRLAMQGTSPQVNNQA